MSGDGARSELCATWEAAAPGWAKWERALSAGLSDATDALIDAAAISPGMCVLDLACGAGAQSIRAAGRVGPGGRVVASDISPTMLQHVRQNAAQAGLANIETLECAAEALGADTGPFDAAICRLGLMLFPAPALALGAVGQALKPGARFAALVFSTPAQNPFMARSMAILLRHAGKSPPPPGRPGIFALGGDGVLTRLLAESGFADIRVQTVRARLALTDAAEAFAMMQQAFGAYRAVVADLGEPERAAAWAEVKELLRTFESGDRFETSLEFLIGSGARPR